MATPDVSKMSASERQALLAELLKDKSLQVEPAKTVLARVAQTDGLLDTLKTSSLAYQIVRYGLDVMPTTGTELQGLELQFMERVKKDKWTDFVNDHVRSMTNQIPDVHHSSDAFNKFVRQTTMSLTNIKNCKRGVRNTFFFDYTATEGVLNGSQVMLCWSFLYQVDDDQDDIVVCAVACGDAWKQNKDRVNLHMRALGTHKEEFWRTQGKDLLRAYVEHKSLSLAAKALSLSFKEEEMSLEDLQKAYGMEGRTCGHTLKFYRVQHNNWGPTVCDTCPHIFKADEFAWGCRICNFDRCLRCKPRD